MTVSVVIPAYNEEKFIKACVESLINQTEKADEIIVIDNNCTDKTAEIARSFPEVTVVQEKKQGMIYSRNAGFNAAKSEIIARCDADTIVSKDWIHVIKNHFSTTDCDALSGSLTYYDMPLKVGAEPFVKLYMQVTKRISGDYVLVGPNMAFKKSIWEQIKNEVCLDASVVLEDVDLTYHIRNNGGKICYNSDMRIKTSARRILRNPKSFFIEYPLMFNHIKKTHSLQKSKNT